VSTTATRRVIVLAPDFASRGGIEYVSRLTCRALSGLAVETGALVEARALFDGAPDDFTVPLVTTGGSRLRLGARLVRELGLKSADQTVLVMHLHFAPLMIPAVMAGARVVVWLHGIEADRPLSAPERWLIARAWRTVSVSAATAALWQQQNPRLAPAAVCHLGIPAMPACRSAADAAPRALIVGRLDASERYKGHDQLIDIWPDVARVVPGATLTIVGDGNDRCRLEERVRDAGLGQWIVFTGEVTDAALAALFEDSACYVMPSSREGFGLTYLEAMRARRPCIASPGAPEEIVVDGVTGVIVPASRRTQLTAAVVNLLSNRSERARMGDAGRERFEQRFTEAHFAERLRAILDA
jgi:glycosyltransferase involved in cell wall biosynthesis